MEKRRPQHGLIASENLSLAHVPPDDAKLEVLEAFCLTIDGYQDGRYSIEELLREAERVERARFENATLDELRVAAFIRQRELRWSSDGDETALPPLIRKIRNLVAEIRQARVRGRRGCLRLTPKSHPVTKGRKQGECLVAAFDPKQTLGWIE